MQKAGTGWVLWSDISPASCPSGFTGHVISACHLTSCLSLGWSHKNLWKGFFNYKTEIAISVSRFCGSDQIKWDETAAMEILCPLWVWTVWELVRLTPTPFQASRLMFVEYAVFYLSVEGTWLGQALLKINKGVCESISACRFIKNYLILWSKLFSPIFYSVLSVVKMNRWV